MSLGGNPRTCTVTNLTLRQSFSTLAQMNFGQISLIWELMRYQGNITCKDGHKKKDRNGMDLTEAEDIKKR